MEVKPKRLRPVAMESSGMLEASQGCQIWVPSTDKQAYRARTRGAAWRASYAPVQFLCCARLSDLHGQLLGLL